MSESLSLIVDRLSTLADMANETLVITVDKGQPFPVEITIGKNSYYTHNLSDQEMITALSTLSQLVLNEVNSKVSKEIEAHEESKP
jgi:hypothetical protein